MAKFSIRRLFDVRDMTSGSPMACIAQFSVPLLIGNLAQQLYSTVDSIVVGQYVGDGALAAVGASNPVINLLLVLFIGISTGAGIMVSQYFGAKQREQLSMTVGNCMTLTLLSSLVITVLGVVITRPLMGLLNTPEEIFDMACDYMLIIFLGNVGTSYYNIVSGILRGLGDSFTPLVFLLVACGLNIVLDLYFVAVLGMGVAGAAWATIISQIISAILCILRLWRMKDIISIDRKTLRLHGFYALQLARLGLPSGITQGIFSLAMIVVQSLTNSFGEQFIAANVIVMRVDGFAMMPNFSFGTTMTTYAGQNVGARKYDRVYQGARQGTLIAMATSATITGLILIFGRQLMGIFTDTVSLVDLSRRMMGILAVGYIAMAVTQCLQGTMRGAGDSMTPMWISIITTIVIRIPVAYGIAFLTRTPELPNGRQECVFISLLVSWVMGAVISTIFYRLGRWKKKALVM